MSLSYSGLTNYGKVSLPSVSGWNMDSGWITRDPPRSVQTRKVDRVGDTSQITIEIDEQASRACENIRVYARGTNPMVSVDYGTNGSNGGVVNALDRGNAQTKLPYRIMNAGAFRPPVLTQEELQALSRQNRAFTQTLPNPCCVDFTKSRLCGDPNSKSCHQDSRRAHIIEKMTMPTGSSSTTTQRDIDNLLGHKPPGVQCSAVAPVCINYGTQAGEQGGLPVADYVHEATAVAPHGTNLFVNLSNGLYQPPSTGTLRDCALIASTRPSIFQPRASQPQYMGYPRDHIRPDEKAVCPCAVSAVQKLFPCREAVPTAPAPGVVRATEHVAPVKPVGTQLRFMDSTGVAHRGDGTPHPADICRIAPEVTTTPAPIARVDNAYNNRNVFLPPKVRPEQYTDDRNGGNRVATAGSVGDSSRMTSGDARMTAASRMPHLMSSRPEPRRLQAAFA